MKHRYVLLSTTFFGNRTYGIGYVEYDGRHTVLVASYPDLSHRPSVGRRLVYACNRLALDPAHLADVVVDFADFSDTL